MPAFLLGRLGALAATLVVASLVVFGVLELLPGDPALVMLGTGATPESLAALRAELGLDEPALVRYLAFVAGLLSGDLGVSHTYGVPVAGLIAERARVSLPLALVAMTIALGVGLPLGVMAAAEQHRTIDRMVLGVTRVAIAVPTFWLGLLGIYLFAVTLRWLPSGGFPGWEKGIGPALLALILPALALGLPQAAILARIMRTSLIEVLAEPFMRTARAKGLSRAAAIRRHGVRNALIPVLTLLGLQASFLIAGTLIVESVFYLPGLGRLLFQAVTARDLVTVRALVMVMVTAVVVIAFLVDAAYVIADPRLRRRA